MCVSARSRLPSLPDPPILCTQEQYESHFQPRIWTCKHLLYLPLGRSTLKKCLLIELLLQEDCSVLSDGIKQMQCELLLPLQFQRVAWSAHLQDLCQGLHVHACKGVGLRAPMEHSTLLFGDSSDRRASGHSLIKFDGVVSSLGLLANVY